MYDVIQCERLTATVSRVLLQMPAHTPLVYQAGQYIKVVQADGVLSPLSIACAPHDASILELHLAHPAENPSAQALLNLIYTEKKLQLQGPYGTCIAKNLIQQQPVIFLTRGTGFAPIKAMLEEAHAARKTPPMHLYWSATRREDLYLLSLVESWAKEWNHFSFTPVLTSELLQQAVLRDYSDLSLHQVYASVSPAMVYEIGNHLFQHGLKKESYFSDVFDYV